MLHRWDSRIEDLNLILCKLREISKRIIKRKKTRGTKPKHSIADYTALIVLKEASNRTQRGAEVNISGLVCGERVDHSVIAYWEKKEEILEAVAKIISIAGAMLNKLLSSLFTFVDSTKFSNWNIKETEIFVCNKIANGTVYPVGISFLTHNVRDPVNECLPSGNKILYADAWFDDNKALEVMFKKGYIPVVCPNKNRWKGHYRKRARRIYNQPVHRLGYRQRGRGESLFGSLTNKHGDRFTSKDDIVMEVRIASRVLAYQLRILLRATLNLLLIVRHALNMINFKKGDK